MSKLNRFRVVSAYLGWLVAIGGALAEGGAATPSLPVGPTLVFSSETNRYEAKAGEVDASFTIYATNVWTNAIVIQEVQASCHCTVATLPSNPWILMPSESGAISAYMELAGQEGLVSKTLTFFTSVGQKVVTLEALIPPPLRQPDQPLTEDERAAARLKAMADSHALFQGDCAVCHVEKSRGLLGKNLFVSACGICHDSPRRAGMVPDLRALKQATNLADWKTIISNGKPHSLMPGFAEAQGGPLTPMQVDSLATYLEQTMPRPARARERIAP